MKGTDEQQVAALTIQRTSDGMLLVIDKDNACRLRVGDITYTIKGGASDYTWDVSGKWHVVNTVPV